MDHHRNPDPQVPPPVVLHGLLRDILDEPMADQHAELQRAYFVIDRVSELIEDELFLVRPDEDEMSHPDFL